MKFPDMDRKSFIASPASGNESWGGERDPSDSPRKSTWPSPWIGRSRIKVDVLSSWSLPESVIRPSAAGKNIFHFLWEILLPLHWVFQSRFLMRPSFSNSSTSATNMSPFQIPPAYKAYPRNNPGKTFFPTWWILDWSFAVIGWYSTNEPNGIIGA